MPLTVDDFIEQLPDLVALRRSLSYTAPESHERPRLLQQLADREAEARRRWEAGQEGWMTPPEAEAVAAGLIAEAERAQRVGIAEVRGQHLVFWGGAHGEQLLSLGGTSPVRARKHWLGYLEVCPSTAPVVEPTVDVPAPREQHAQLSWLDKLGDLLGGPKRPRPEKRGRFLSIPLGRPRK